MKNLIAKTPLKEYFLKHRLKVKDFSKKIGLHPQQLYKILQGKVRPNTETAKKIKSLVNDELTIDQIRPPLQRPKCPCCGRLLKKHHLRNLKLEETKKEKAKKNSTGNEKKSSKKIRKGLLSL